MFKKVIILLSFVLVSSLAYAEVNGSQDSSVMYYRVEGNVENSFYPQNDTDYLYEGNINFTDNPGDNEISGNVLYRLTDDRLMDTRDVSLENFALAFKTATSELNLGDYYAFLSEYTLNNAIKGIHYRLGQDDSSYLKILGGIDTARWEDLWETRQDDSIARKYIAGMQFGTFLLDKKINLNLNYGSVINDKAYLDSYSNEILTNVVSLSGTYKINESLNSEFELGQSYVDENKNNDAIKTKSDSAYKVILDYNAMHYSATTLYSRVGSHYQTTSGFISSDIETINYDAVLFLPKNIQLTHYVHTDHDNLSKHLSTTTKQLNPGFAFNFVFFTDWDFNLGYDIRKRDTVDKAVNERTNTYFISVAKAFKYAYTNLEYTRLKVFDKIYDEQERKIDMFALNLDGDFDFKTIQFNWSLGESISREEYRYVDEADIALAHSMGFRMQLPSSLYFDAKASVYDNDFYINSSDNSLTDYCFETGYSIKESLQLKFVYEHRGYSYADPDNNFSETRLTGSLSYQF